MVSPARIRTNRLLAKAFNLNDFLDPTRLAHDELQYYNDLTRLFDKIIGHHIDWLDSPEAKKVFYEDIQNREEYFQAIDQDLDDIINDVSLNADKIIEKVYRKGLNHGYKDINRLPVFNDACKYGLKATQEYNFELIRNVSDDLIESIRHHIFRGIAEGQSIHEVARAITDSGLKPLKNKTLTAYQRASLIARTEIARSMTTGRLQSYANYGVEKVKILTAGDDNVCPICLEAAHIFNGEKTHDNIIGEKVYSLEDASDILPFHPACRCSLIAYIEHYQDIPQKPIENPRFMDCSPNDTILLPRTSWTKREIREALNRYVKNKDLDLIANQVFEFIMKADEHPNIECGASFDNEFKLIDEFIEGDRQGVDIPYNEDGVGLTIHSHSSGIPFPSGEDIKRILEYNSEYNIIYTPAGLVIIKNKHEDNVMVSDDSFEEYNKKSDEINNKIKIKKRNIKNQARIKYVPDVGSYVSINMRDYIRENGESYINQLTPLINDNSIEINFIVP